MSKKSEATIQIENVAKKSEEIGNICYDDWKESKNPDTAKLTISSFRNVLYANSILIKMSKQKP